ncbi:MAG: PD-(D/E)XK nuclease family protein [Acidimicrobiia bacterium]
MADVRAVAYGRAATEALRAAIGAAQDGDRLAPVTVVVSSNSAGLSARRTLAERAGLANVGFVTPFALAERLGRPRAVAAGLLPLTEPVLVAAIRVELRAAPGFFTSVADHPATEAALARRYAELTRARPETLERIRRHGSTRAQELVRLFDRVRARLAGHVDEERLVTHALAAVAAGDPTVAALGSVVVHLPQPLPPALHDLVGVLTQARPAAWVVGITGDRAADAPVVAACARWGVTVAAATEDAGTEPLTTGTEMISASDVDEEIRAVTRRLVQLAGAGVRMDRTAIVFPGVEPYARTVDAVLTAAGLAHNGPGIRRLADSVAGRTLTRLVGMVESRFARDDVIALLASAPVRGADGRAVPVERWDLVSRRAGVVDGDDWDQRLDRYATDMHERDRARAAEEGRPFPGGDEPRPGSVARSARDLAAFVAQLRERLAALAVARGWRVRAEEAGRALTDLLGGPSARRRWPEEEQEAFDAVLGALDRLAELELVEAAPHPGAFGRAVESELAATSGRTGRFGEGILCVPIGAAVGLDLDAIAVVGLAEGQLPVVRREDALLGETDRQLAVDAELAVRESALADQRRAYLAALAAGADHRILSSPRGDLRTGRERLPSRFLLETASALTGRRVFGSELGQLSATDGLDAVSSFAAGITRCDDAATAAERELGVVARFVTAGGDAAAFPTVASTSVATGIDATRGRESAALTRWDGNVGRVRGQVRSPATGDVVSPTRLQDWASCPFRYFLANVLRVEVEETPERLLELSALERGTLVHGVLERFVAEELARPESERTPVGQPWPADASRRILAIMDACAAETEAKGLTGKATLWALHREDIAADLLRFLAEDSRRRVDHGVVPESVEIPFGMDGVEPVSVTLPDGRPVAFRGRADRVDVRADGTRVVVDYKTGRANEYDVAYEHDPVKGGARLQLPVYAEAARQRLGATDVEAAYWFVSDKGGFEYERFVLDDESEARFRDVVGHIVDGIDAGSFPAAPGEFDAYFGSHANCRYCKYDDVCPVDREAQQDAKLGAPELADFRALFPDEDEAT